jgi:hypothetical protein
MEHARAEDFVRRIATAVRGADLYSPTHPLVQRGIDNLIASAQPQVKILIDKTGVAFEEPRLANPWERDGPGEHRYAVIEAIDPESVSIDPLAHL